MKRSAPKASPTKWLLVLERESQEWQVVGPAPWTQEEYYPTLTSRRMKKRYVQYNFVIPKPEDVSPFVAGHTIIEAKTEEEACRSASTYPKPRSATR